MLQLFRTLFGNKRDQDAMLPLYNAIVVAARQAHWYKDAQIPDTLDGRFDVLVSLMSLVLVRMEQLQGQEQNSVWLTEVFVEDMDSQLREIGVGDYSVGKHVGKIMSALGGRLEAFRETITTGQSLQPILLRNIYNGDAPNPDAMAACLSFMDAHWTALQRMDEEAILNGELGL